MAGTMTPQGSTPVPDPTELTDKAIAKAVVLLTQYIDGQITRVETRLDGSDKATTLRLQEIDGIPSRIDEKVNAALDLTNEKFSGVQQQFNLNALALAAALAGQEKAVQTALLAQQQAAAKQDESNQKAIDKSETATEKTITTNLTLTRATTDALAKGLDEVKTRVTAIESGKNGANEQRTEARQSNAAVYAAIGFGISIIVFLILIVGLIIEAQKSSV